MRRLYPLPDAILLLYVVCIAREYFWVLGGSAAKNLAAWAIATIIGLMVLWWFTSHRDGWEGTESAIEPGWHSWRSASSNQFDWLWLFIVVTPMLIFFFLRAPFPSLDFDNLNYHLVNTERALRGWPMIPGDFFPGTLLVNPAPDMAFGALRAVIGHRLAPLLNIAALIWTANVLNEILASLVRRKSLRYLAVLLIVATEHVMFLVNLYMVDLLALPLLLSALLMTVRFAESTDKGRTLVKIAFLFGLSLAFKLTNICIVLPIGLLLFFEIWQVYRREKSRPSALHVFAAVAAVVLPGLFFYLYMYRETGNPLFPYYNQIFRSPLMQPVAYLDATHGPANLWQKVTWPIVSFIFPERLSAMGTTIYSGRLNLGFIISFACLFVKATPKVLTKIFFVMVVSTIIWSFLSGDIRYALSGELLGGIASLFALVYIYQMIRENQAPKDRFKQYLAAGLYTFFLAISTLSGIWAGLIHFECSSGARFCDRAMQPYFMTNLIAPTFKYFYRTPIPRQMNLEASPTYFREATFFFRDQHGDRFLSESDRALFRDVDLWLNCYDSTSGFMVLAAPTKPMISVAKFLDLFNYMEAPGARQRVREILAQERGKKIYTLLLEDQVDLAAVQVQRSMVGLRLSNDIKHVSLPLYSNYSRQNLVLVRVEFDESPQVASGR